MAIRKIRSPSLFPKFKLVVLGNFHYAHEQYVNFVLAYLTTRRNFINMANRSLNFGRCIAQGLLTSSSPTWFCFNFPTITAEMQIAVCTRPPTHFPAHTHNKIRVVHFPFLHVLFFNCILLVLFLLCVLLLPLLHLVFLFFFLHPLLLLGNQRLHSE